MGPKLKSEVDPLDEAAVASPEERKAAKPRQEASQASVEAEPVVPVSAPAAARKVWVVRRKITVSWSGQMLNLAEGKEIHEGLYGAGSIERLRNAGVDLVEKV